MSEENKNKKVNFKVFVWAIGIILLLFGFVFSNIQSVRSNNQELNGLMANIQIQLSQIQTDLKWICEELDKK